MAFEGILIGTAILWGLTALVVQPIVNHLVTGKLKMIPAYATLLAKPEDEV